MQDSIDQNNQEVNLIGMRWFNIWWIKIGDVDNGMENIDDMDSLHVAIDMEMTWTIVWLIK
jgi:hypothetical protein